MDVTPRTAPPDGELPYGLKPRRPRKRGQGLAVGVVLVAVLGAVGFLLVKQVGSASLYYYNADEAVAKRAELGNKRFRVQGTYEGSKKELASGAIQFRIAFGGVAITVDHTGSQPALFKPGIPVVLQGRWSDDGRTFLSDRIEVKHSEVYKAKNPDRVDPASP